ncbi:hypothetical protein C9397_06770 [Xanthomonas vasicola pv. vasculorum]|uniref:Uncharacterized protein n=1 Tax=Xanthomonas vasicola pv. vasculorum TaxID=325776 RepID=A0AAE8F3M6_XANVA|nr:hypothetical protein C7V42_14210 [Xanthomonas vasicola pv. vasculorum]AZR36992.1 hypothetical protein NX08_014270 [Xanthomonas vasicola]AZM71791.1 hypothetical protein CXP37_14220 [Xanthomonas vasicola pv. vasculorum]OWF64396.1 hypothetical protein B1H32_01800 [Xanthomonas vasicola pv. vasculorum]OWF64592.1 hypothetical protein B1H41_00775 [Xanthomonas vasicola pv. vasculorum]
MVWAQGEASGTLLLLLLATHRTRGSMRGCGAAMVLAMHCAGAQQQIGEGLGVSPLRYGTLMGFAWWFLAVRCISAWRRVDGFRDGYRYFFPLARGDAFVIPGAPRFTAAPLKPRSRGVGQASRLLPPPGRSSRLCP